MDDIQSGWKRWLGGIIFPIILLYLGIAGVIHRSFTLDVNVISRLPFTEIIHTFNGASGVIASIAVIALAALCHAFFFWEDNDRLDTLRTRVVVGSAIVVAISVCVCIGILLFSHH